MVVGNEQVVLQRVPDDKYGIRVNEIEAVSHNANTPEELTLKQFPVPATRPGRYRKKNQREAKQCGLHGMFLDHQPDVK